MAEKQKVYLKRSNVSGKTPTADQLQWGEVAVNYAAGSERLFVKNSSGDVISFLPDHVIIENEEVTAIALNDLDGRIKDLSAVTSTKVDKVSGKGLSTNDYTTEDKTKLASIDAGAQANVITGVTAVSATTANKVVTVTKVNSASTADSSAKLSTNAGTSVRPVYFSGGVPKECTSIDEAKILYGKTSSFSNDLSAIDVAVSSLHSANRLCLGNPDGVTVEYSTDGGSSWLDYGANDGTKIGLISNDSYVSVYIGKKTSEKASTQDMLRITLNAPKLKVYTQAQKILINISTNGASGCQCKIESSKINAPTNFTEYGTFPINGWSGWNSIPICTINSNGYFGGSTSQTGQCSSIRMTFSITSVSSTYRSNLQVLNICLFGKTYWTTPSQMAKDGHLYSYDYLQNAKFPKALSATTFVENGTSLANKYQAKSSSIVTAVTLNTSSTAAPSISNNVLTLNVKDGTTGFRGNQGAQGDKGAQGAQGPIGTNGNAISLTNASASQKVYLTGTLQTGSTMSSSTWKNLPNLTYSGNTLFNNNEIVSTKFIIPDNLFASNPAQITTESYEATKAAIKQGKILYRLSGAGDALQCSATLTPIYKDNNEGIVIRCIVYRNGAKINSERAVWKINTGSKVSYSAETITLSNSLDTSDSPSKLFLVGANIQANDGATTKTNSGVYTSGSAIYAKNGFYETSDERKKEFISDIDCDLDALSNIPKKYFRWNGGDENSRYIGTSAQEVMKLYPEIVTKDDEGYLHVSYDKFGIIALAAIDKLREENRALMERIEALEKKMA